MLDDALAISEADGYDDIGVLVYAQRGVTLLREGQLKDALAQLDHAVDFLEYAPPVDRAKVLLNRGELHGLLGDLAQAKDDCALELRLALESGPAELVFYATHNLGWYEFLSGNLPRALELMPTGEDALPTSTGMVGMDRAKALLSAGLVTEADRSLIDVCAAFGRTELVQFLAEAELTRAEVALLADQPISRHTLSPRRSPGSSGGATGGPSRSVSWSSCEPTSLAEPAGIGCSERADRLVKTFTELGLRDQERMARLIAIEHAGTNGTQTRVLPQVRPEQPLDLRLYNRLVRAKAAYARGETRRRAATGEPASPRSPSTRPNSAVSTCRSPARPTASTWRRWRSPRRSSMADPDGRVWPGWNALAPSPHGCRRGSAAHRIPMTADLLGQLRWVDQQSRAGADSRAKAPRAWGQPAGASCSERSAPAPGRSRARARSARYRRPQPSGPSSIRPAWWPSSASRISCTPWC